MSSKNRILPADILEAVMAMPTMTKGCANKTPIEKAKAVLAARKPSAFQTRVVVYRYDGDGQGREMCDKVQTGLQSGELPFHDICRKLDAGLQLIELGHGVPTAEDNARAAAFGMMAAEEGTGLLIITAFGAEPAKKRTEMDFLAGTTPDTAALFGAIVSAARAGIPVIAEGLKALEAAYALFALRPDLCETLFVCGVPTSVNDLRFTIFADDKADHPAYAGVALAALFLAGETHTEAA